MRYLGGKSRIGKEIASIINGLDFQTYWEPFCGMFSVGKYVKGIRVATDAHPDLIYLLNAVQNGFQPPTNVSEENYKDMRHLPPSAFRGLVAALQVSFLVVMHVIKKIEAMLKAPPEAWKN